MFDVDSAGARAGAWVDICGWLWSSPTSSRLVMASCISNSSLQQRQPRSRQEVPNAHAYVRDLVPNTPGEKEGPPVGVSGCFRGGKSENEVFLCMIYSFCAKFVFFFVRVMHFCCAFLFFGAVSALLVHFFDLSAHFVTFVAPGCPKFVSKKV